MFGRGRGRRIVTGVKRPAIEKEKNRSESSSSKVSDKSIKDGILEVRSTQNALVNYLGKFSLKKQPNQQRPDILSSEFHKE